MGYIGYIGAVVPTGNIPPVKLIYLTEKTQKEGGVVFEIVVADAIEVQILTKT